MAVLFLIIGITCFSGCLFFTTRKILTLENKINLLESYCIETNKRVEETLMLSSGKTPLFESETNKINKAQLGNMSSIWSSRKEITTTVPNKKREVIPIKLKKGSYRIYRDSTVEEVLDILGSPYDTKTSGSATYLTYEKTSYSYLHLDFDKNKLVEIH